MIPKPLPFMRLGLANMPLIAALDILPVEHFVLLIFIKILGQGLITGSLFSSVFLFSLAGTLASGTVMYLLRRCLGAGRVSFIGVSTAGALISNGVQLALARVFIFGEGVLFIAPPFLGLGVLAGMALGLFCEIFAARSVWYRTCRGLPAGDRGALRPRPYPDRPDQATPRRGNSGGKGGVPDRDLLFAGVIMLAAFLFNPSTVTRGMQFLLFGIYARLTGKKPAPLFTLFIMGAVVFCNLLVPYGRVLAEFGPFRLTRGSLLSGLHKAVTLEGLFFLSKATIRPDLRFPGRFGFFIGESFRLLDRLIEQKGRITRKHFIEGIDTLLVELSAEEASPPAAAGNPPEARPPKRALPGMLLLAGTVLLTVGLALAGLTGSGSAWEPVALVDFLHRYAKNLRLLGSFMQFVGYKNSLL
jgi:heptaprenyl diphosphate synthase